MTGYKSKKAAALDKLDDDDDTQVYKDHGDALTAAYMSGYHDGKKAAQRPWVDLTDDEIKEIVGPYALPIIGYTRKLFDQIEAKLREKNGA